MKLTLPAIPVIGLVAIIAVGCATKKQAPAASSALDVTPVQTGGGVTSTPTYTPPATAAYTTPTYSAGAGYTAPAASPTFSEPATTSTPVSAEPKTETKSKWTASSATTGGNSSSSSYTVQKGDTLFKIAKDHYGDGKQYTKIVAANPGLEPSKLKVGQKITLP